MDEFLTGIFLNTVAAGVVNTVGKQTVKGINSDYINGLANIRGIRVVDVSAEKEAPSTKLLENEETT